MKDRMILLRGKETLLIALTRPLAYRHLRSRKLAFSNSKKQD